MRVLAGAAAVVAAVALTAGCAPARAVVDGTPSAAASSSATAGDSSPLLTEVRRELAAMRTSHYQHQTKVDEATGSFRYDCSGLLDYALKRVLPADLAALPVTTSTRPLAADIEHHLRAAGGASDPWRPVATVAALAPGDVVAWLATEDSTTGDTGHVMIVTGSPSPDPGHGDQWLVPVADSTLHPHADDSRHDDDTGLGTGTIGLVVDGRGAPVAFAWRGGISTKLQPTEIALGRPT